MYSFIALTALAALASVQQVSAVCASGQMAVGQAEMSQWSGTNSVNFFTGFLMDNNCNLIAESGQTTDSQEVCDGHDYNNGADVWCSGGIPVTAKDTKGQWWNCKATSDRSCNKNIGSLGGYMVMACCSRQ